MTETALSAVVHFKNIHFEEATQMSSGAKDVLRCCGANLQVHLRVQRLNSVHAAFRASLEVFPAPSPIFAMVSTWEASPHW